MKHFAIRQLMAQAAWDRGLDPERLPAWRAALLAEIARGRRVSSRGHFNPRGVKRKMSNFSVRHRGAKLHRRHEPAPSDPYMHSIWSRGTVVTVRKLL